MTSNINISQTSFLEACISRKIKFQDIHEILGLYKETINARKVPVFVKDEAKDLEKKIQKIVAAFKASYRNNKEKMLADLAKDDAFASQSQELGQCYRLSLWGRGNHWPSQYGGQVPELRWDSNQESICFYIRCWITRQVAETVIPPKGKARAYAALPSTTTSNKRKTSNVSGQPASKKSQKVTNKTESSEGSLRGRKYSISRSPAPVFPILETGMAHRGQRESTCDTDRTYAPTKEAIIETEATIDANEMMTGTRELLLDVRTSDDEDFSHATRSPTAGPSGTYRNPQRHDPVNPSSTQHNESCYQADQALSIPHDLLDTTRRMWQSTSVPTQQIDVSNFEKRQQKQFRMELFKLLLSYLNRLNQFSTVCYEPEAEERMNHLLDQFWNHDAETIRSRVGMRFSELQTAWQRWITMRHQLAKFQRTTGYSGKPGNDWKEHLTRMDRVTHAKASIAFVDFKSFANTRALATDSGSQFDNDIMTVFDSLTQVEGCNGVGEFEALRAYNEELLGWFS